MLASEPYEENKSFKYHAKNYKLSPYDREVCKKMERTYAYLPELFSNNLKIVDGKIQFYYHDLSLIEGLFQYGKDGLAVDVLMKEQYNCAHGNALHPSSVNDGMLLKPIMKKKLIIASIVAAITATTAYAYIQCPTCKGSGWDKNLKCLPCGGDGKIGN